MLDEIIKLKVQLRDSMVQHWLSREFLTWVWWLDIAMIIVCLVVWWKVVDKKRLLEISIFGLLINVSSVFLDVLGSEFALWEYPVHILPQVPLLFPVDFVILPIMKMTVYQKCPRWGMFLIVSTITAALASFVFEPLAVWIGQYKLITWKYYYSLPIYILIAVFGKLVVQKFLAVQKKSASSPR